MVTDYDATMILFTNSDTHSPALFSMDTAITRQQLSITGCTACPSLTPTTSFGVVLSHEIFSTSRTTNINASVRVGGSAGASRDIFSIKKKEEAMSMIADSMTVMMVDNQNRNLKCTEKMQLEHDTALETRSIRMGKPIGPLESYWATA
jgi:hypothetical protein